ncbi:MAG: hypothetical protein ACLTJE_01785 [Enterocloster bolteae]|uniref:hypothetical protein n=1 Tax=Enterocloster bolteae TaxID=208479 RepID=UPI0039965741
MSFIIGVMGSHSGWVVDSKDLYLRGNNPGGFGLGAYMGRGQSGSMTLESGYLRISGLYPEGGSTSGCGTLVTNKSYNLSGYSRLTLSMGLISGNNVTRIYLYLSTSRSAKYDYMLYQNVNGGNSSYNVTFNISSFDVTRFIGFEFDFGGTSTTYHAIYQIRLT